MGRHAVVCLRSILLSVVFHTAFSFHVPLGPPRLTQSPHCCKRGLGHQRSGASVFNQPPGGINHRFNDQERFSLARRRLRTSKTLVCSGNDPKESLQVSEEDDALFFFGALFEYGLGFGALLVAFLIKLQPLGPSFVIDAPAVALGLAWTLPPLGLMLLLQQADTPGLREIKRITEAFARRLFLQRGNAELLLFSLGAGFGEELLFRGVLQQGFVAALMAVGLGAASLPIGVAAVALLFGAAHNLTPLYFQISCVGSLIFSGMFISSGNILVPILAHSLYDFIALKVLMAQITLAEIRKDDEAGTRGKTNEKGEGGQNE